MDKEQDTLKKNIFKIKKYFLKYFKSHSFILQQAIIKVYQ